MKKSILALALASASCLLITGCNSDSDSDDNVSSSATGDTIILTADGSIASVNRDTPDQIVSSKKISMLQANDQLVGIDYRPKDEKLYAVGLQGNLYTVDPSTGAATFLRKLT
ncbi:MAG: DUF4394 domain-containing protein, partial [Acinetobacter sp.]